MDPTQVCNGIPESSPWKPACQAAATIIWSLFLWWGGRYHGKVEAYKEVAVLDPRRTPGSVGTRIDDQEAPE